LGGSVSGDPGKAHVKRTDAGGTSADPHETSGIEFQNQPRAWENATQHYTVSRRAGGFGEFTIHM